MAKMERVDLLSFKAKLKLVLKENDNKYWDNLRKFLQARLTKRELDTYARSVLVTDENVTLHNLFVKSIINNAYCNLGPPPVAPYDKRATIAPILGPAKKEKKRRMREAYKQPEPVLPTPQLEVKTMIIPRPDLQLNLLPNSELVALRTRIYRIATEKGLTHVDNEAVLYTMSAIEEYLKNILSTVRAEHQVVSHTENTSNGHRVITKEDLLKAVEARPTLFGEDQSVNQERISFAL